MARLKIELDLVLAQKIIDKLEKEQTWSSLSPFLQAVMIDYNAQSGSNVDWQVLRLRLNAGFLRVSVQPGKRGRAKGETISESQAKVMYEGRKKTLTNKVILTDQNEIAAEALRKRWGKQFPKLVEKTISGSRVAAQRLGCLICVGADKDFRETIRNCSALTCTHYYNRPFIKNTEENDVDTD
jgi:hypothetical protein